MAKKPARKARVKKLDLSDEDHDADGNIRPEVQARVDEEQRQFMAERKKQRDAEEKAERENYKGKLERGAQRRAERDRMGETLKALAKILADHEARMQAKGI